MIDPKHLAHDDRQVAALVAICAMSAEYPQEVGQAALAGVLPSTSTPSLDRLLGDVQERLDVAGRLLDDGDEDQAREWIESAKAEIQVVVFRDELQVDAA
jgi:hypothetical protein